jgi:hypothetical protein
MLGRPVDNEMENQAAFMHVHAVTLTVERRVDLWKPPNSSASIGQCSCNGNASSTISREAREKIDCENSSGLA